MSDKSFGDHTNRNIVKNPLLSSAVTGLSLEDLTHKAVLLPVIPSLDQISRSDQQQGLQTQTLAQAKHDTPVFPSGDAFSNIALSNPQATKQNVLDSKNIVNLEENRNITPVIQTKASLKSDDDFDVNEYIARLQGTRYVSAPLYSNLKEDQKANLEATEENLEEINLNESVPAEVQQSLTADIAQNFSQLPTVLPHVASAVFSSFSNMLSYKGKEPTPDRPKEADHSKAGYDEVQFQRPPDVGVPLMGVEEYKAPTEVAPPPKEPLIGSTSNYRITSKKKYAQIPGLSSGEHKQNMAYPPGQSIPMNMPPMNLPMPPKNQSIPSVVHNMPIPMPQNMVPTNQNFLPPQPPYTQKVQDLLSNTQHELIGQNTSQFSQNVTPLRNVPAAKQNITNVEHNAQLIGQSPPQFGQSIPPVGQNVTFLDPNKAYVDDEHTKNAEPKNIRAVSVTQSQYNIMNPASSSQQDIIPEQHANETQHNLFTNSSHSFFTPVEMKQQNIPVIPPSASIIPPPPMFSNLPRRDGQYSGRSILPPSVARRISANQHISKPATSSPTFTENIFVPAPVSEIADQEKTDNSFPSIFSSEIVQESGSSSIFETPNNILPPAHIGAPFGIQPANFISPALYFTPSNEEKLQTVTGPPQSFISKIAPMASAGEGQNNVSLPSITATTSYVTCDRLPVAPIFTPATVEAPISQPPLQNGPPSTFFNPVQVSSSSKAPHPITQMPLTTSAELPKPVPEPPKATGTVNFRMTKKRPQYYAGPIDGVGAISNNVKPVIAPVNPSVSLVEGKIIHGAIFTPEQSMLPATDQFLVPNIEKSSVPLDISRSAESEGENTPLDMGIPQDQAYGTFFSMRQPESYNYEKEYNTPFDVSRDSADAYNEPKQETGGFGIIGSLKSKLSSLDINKIQSTVTTFFDPAYNVTKVFEPEAQNNIPYQRQHLEVTPLGQSNFDIFVPDNEHNQYSEYKEDSFGYSQIGRYHQSLDPHTQNQEQSQNMATYSTASYFTNPNYSTDQVYSSNPLYDNTQISYPIVTNSNRQQNNISEYEGRLDKQTLNTENTAMYDPNFNKTQKILTMPHVDQHLKFDVDCHDENYVSNTQIGRQTADCLDSNLPSNMTNINTPIDSQHKAGQSRITNDVRSEDMSIMNYYCQIWQPQPSQDYPATFILPTINNERNTSILATENKQDPMIYNPNAFNAQQVIGNEKTHDVQKNTNDVDTDSQSKCDSVLNTSKYNMSSIRIQSTQQNVIMPVPSFSGNTISTNLPLITKAYETDIDAPTVVETKDNESQDQFHEYVPTSKTPLLIDSRSQDYFYNVDDNKNTQLGKEEPVQDHKFTESLSKEDISVGVSSVPLYGLSAMVTEKTKKLSLSEIMLLDQSKHLFEENTARFLLKDNNPENPKQEEAVPLDITSLSIHDVKNVLLIEPPQENIGALLKRNASSSMLEHKSTEKILSEHFTQQSDDISNSTLNSKETIQMFKHKYIATEQDFENVGTIDVNESNSELNIRDTCREGNTPDSTLNSKETIQMLKHKYIATEQDFENVGTIDVNESNSELNICDTCREVNTPDHEQKHKNLEDLTTQLIENITSPIQLSHPLTVPLQSEAPTTEITQYDQQLDEITHVAEETFETLQVQSAIELLDISLTTRTSSEIRDYGWITQETVSPPAATLVDHDYASNVDVDPKAVKRDYGFELDAITASNPVLDYELDPNPFASNNLEFFDDVPMPNNASDEIKAEIKHSHEDIILPRQISIPTAPTEEDLKIDEPGVIDVHSIEQDAKKDFPLEEEFAIEPVDDYHSTDDDKIEFRERKRSSEDSTSNDTFTNRIEKFKKNIDNNDGEQKPYYSPPISMASYFDTGNYAVESHFRNSFVAMRIPPGFEEEYARKLSDISLGSSSLLTLSLPDKLPDLTTVPDTSTQTQPMHTSTYASSHDAKENIIGHEMRRKENAEVFTRALAESKSAEKNPVQIIGNPVVSEAAASLFADTTSIQPVFSPVAENMPEKYQLPVPVTGFTHSSSIFPDAIPAHQEVFAQNVQSLPDPINFFTADVDEPHTAEPADPESFSRLASYFSMPPVQPPHSKSFFELSQSQNHYRHEVKSEENKQIYKSFFELSQSQNHYVDDTTKSNVIELMNDLTSPQSTQENIVYNVNYFTVELDNNINRHTSSAAPINVKISDVNNLPKSVETEEPKLHVTFKDNFKHKENQSVKDKDIIDISTCKYCSSYVSGIDINSKDFVVKSAVNDSPERVTADSDMSNQSEISERTKSKVNFAADYDVEKQAEDNVSVTAEYRGGSEYTPVKHHWYYRVDVEEKSVWRGFSVVDSTALEEAYHSPDLNDTTLVATDGGRYDVNVLGRLRIAVYWHEKPTNVRRCSWFYKGTTDARYVPYTESVAEKLEDEYRHGVSTGEWHRKLALPNSEMVIMHGPSVMVHFLHSGALDAFSTPPQTTSRPRVVRRSCEESEIEESEPSRIDHLLLLCHGVGSACDMRFRSVEEVVEDFRATSLQLLQSHYKNSYDNGAVSRVEVLPISWHEQLHSGETGVDRRLACVTLDSIPRLRAFTNHTVLDVLFYTSPVFHQTIIDTVCSELNRVYEMFLARNPHFTGEVSLGGHSLGSVILYDLLCNQIPEPPSESESCSSQKTYVSGTEAGGQLPAKYPQLAFSPAALYALGSPIAIFECIRGVESLGVNFALPTCKNFFNIFHPYDPIAYRIEPLISPQLQDVKPSQIPHHKGRKRMHLELKDTMARVGADLKQKLIESLRTTWNKWKAGPPTDGQLEKVVEEEMEKEPLCEDNEPVNEVEVRGEMLGRLNGGRRVDYVLQEAPLEMINEYLFAMTSHVGYWESEDTMLLMLREIYSALGVQPDSTVPQQTMTVQRNSSLDDGSSSKVSSEPSTSRGSR